MTWSDRLRFPLVLVAVLVLEQTLAPAMAIGGAVPDFLLLVVVATGTLGRPRLAAIVGFVTGLATDLVVTTPFGLSVVADVLVGTAVAVAFAGPEERGRAWVPLIGAVGSAAGVLVYAVLGGLFGQDQMLGAPLVRIVLLVGVVNGVLCLPARAVMRWALVPGELARASAPARRR